MQRPRIEQERIAGTQVIGARAVPIDHLAREHVDELLAAMLEAGVRNRIIAECDQIGLDHDIAAQRRAQKLVDMADLGPAPINRYPLARAHEAHIFALLHLREQLAHRYRQRMRDRLQGCERRGDAAILDLGQHAAGNFRCRGKISHGQVLCAAKLPDLTAQSPFEVAIMPRGRARSGQDFGCGGRRTHARTRPSGTTPVGSTRPSSNCCRCSIAMAR